MYHCAERRRKEKCQNIALGALAGLAVGCSLGYAKGILFAPQAGDKTRKELKELTNSCQKS